MARTFRQKSFEQHRMEPTTQRIQPNRVADRSETPLFVQGKLFAMNAPAPALPRPLALPLEEFYQAGSLVYQQVEIGRLDPDYRTLETLPGQIYHARLGALIQIRDAYERLYRRETDSQQPQPEMRLALNTAYGAFITRYGAINEGKNAGLALLDPDGRSILALENADANKQFIRADIFNQPVSIQHARVE